MLFSPIEEIIEDINFIATHGRGLICLPMRAEMLDGLQIQGAQRKDDDRCSYHRVEAYPREARLVRCADAAPHRVRRVPTFGLEISERVPLEIAPNVESKGYLKTKREKLNHVFVGFQQEVLQ